MSEFSNVEKWAENVKAIGHGKMEDLTPEAAIEIAANSDPLPLQHKDTHDPQGLKTGQQIIVSPDLNGGEQPVEGTLVFADQERIVLKRDEAGTGAIHVHFPRLGYRVDTKA